MISWPTFWIDYIEIEHRVLGAQLHLRETPFKK